jgi:arylsulfatase A-like enzyme
VILAALAAAVLAAPARGQAAERPGLSPRNLLLVTVSDLRPDHMSCYAYPRPTTWLDKDDTQRAQGRAFDIDELARGGVVFAHAYAPAEAMIPSLIALFTGRSPRSIGMLDFDRPFEERLPPTLSEVLRGAGFETVALVTHRPPPTGLNLRRILLERGFELHHQCADDGETLARAREWVAGRDWGSERPFFLWLHLGGLMPPFAGGPDAIAFKTQGYKGPARRPLEFLARVRSGESDPAPEDWQHLDDLYDGALRELTGKLAGFLAEAFDFHLPAAELTETWSRTAVIVTAPTGTDFQRDLRRLGHARNLAEAQLAVPLILRHPDSLTGERVFDDIVELTDVLPTVCEWFALAPPGGVEGRSLFGITDEGREFAQRPAFASLRDVVHTARTPRWRLIWDPERKRFLGLDWAGTAASDALLFDAHEDPRQRCDVAARHPEIVRELRAAIDAWIAASAAAAAR